MRQEYLVIALGAAAVVIVILLGTVIYVMSNQATGLPAGAAPPASSAPALSPEQLEGGLPQGHPTVGGESTGAATTTPGGATATTVP